jgi:hypothetical protein
MVILQTNPNYKILEIDSSLFDEVKTFVKKLTAKKQKSFSYIDELGDKIVVVNGEEFVVPTIEDIETLHNIKKDDFIDEDEVRKLLNV